VSSDYVHLGLSRGLISPLALGLGTKRNYVPHSGESTVHFFFAPVSFLKFLSLILPTSVDATSLFGPNALFPFHLSIHGLLPRGYFEESEASSSLSRVAN